MLEGSTLLVDLDATDVEGQALTWSLDVAPDGMTIDDTTGVITWVPADGAATASVTARATDAGTPAASSTITFGVTVQNVAPTLTLSGAASVDQGTPYTLSLGRTDPGADTLADWEINWGDGQVESVAGTVTTVQHTYFAGGTTYGITATGTDEDGAFPSNTLNVSVAAPNTAPVPQSQTVFLDEDTPTVITLNATDVNGDPLTYTIESAPAFGTLSAIDPLTRQVTFTPAANLRGNDSFTFRASDGLASAVGTITLKIRPVNDVPVADAASFTTAEDTALSGQLTGTDVETPDALTFNLVSGPASGALTLNPDGTFAYDPAANFFGVVSFVFTVTDTGDNELDCGCPLEPSGFVADGPDTSLPVTVTIEVTAVNDDPVATDDGYDVGAGQTLSIDAAAGVLSNDTDVDDAALTVDAVTDDVDHGTLDLLGDGAFTYTPDAGYTGTDRFTYSVRDALGATDTAVVTINVLAPDNRAPVITPITDRTAVEGNVVGFSVDANDPDGDAVTFELVAAPEGASIDAASGLFQWQATDGDANYTFTVRVRDVHDAVADATFVVGVENAPPAIGLVGANTVQQGTPYQLTLGAADPGQDTVVEWEVDWGDGLVETVAGGATLTVEHTYTAATGVFDIHVAATDEDGTWDAPDGLSVTVVPNLLEVTSFTADASGFRVRFSQAVDASTLNLYAGADSDPLQAGAADVKVILGNGPTAIRGSIVMDADARGSGSYAPAAYSRRGPTPSRSPVAPTAGSIRPAARSMAIATALRAATSRPRSSAPPRIPRARRFRCRTSSAGPGRTCECPTTVPAASRCRSPWPMRTGRAASRSTWPMTRPCSRSTRSRRYREVRRSRSRPQVATAHGRSPWSSPHRSRVPARKR